MAHYTNSRYGGPWYEYATPLPSQDGSFSYSIPPNFSYATSPNLPKSAYSTSNNRYTRYSSRTPDYTPTPESLTPTHYHHPYAPLSKTKRPRSRQPRDSFYSYEETVANNEIKSSSRKKYNKQADVGHIRKPGEPMKSPKVTEARLPAGYSPRNWDPTEEPILLLGSAFDANSLRKWIYDWTVSKYGLAGPLTEWASELWLLLKELTNEERSIRRAPGTFRDFRGVLRFFFAGRLLVGASALPVDPGSTSGWPSGPGLPSMTGWPSPCLGLLFAAGATHFSKPHTTSRVPGAMALVFNYLSLVASADVTTSPAIMWTLKGLATYFTVLYGDVIFKKYKMSQGYLALLIATGLLMDYTISQILLAGQGTKSSLTDLLFQFSLPTLSLSLCLCGYHAHSKQNAGEALIQARAEERLRMDELSRQRPTAPQAEPNERPQ